ncbi:MAG TPA: SDR family oxidoreductase [Pseudolabrys sp.]|nr:SDR family oxidoreductase [Pseudolabrys sp.]
MAAREQRLTGKHALITGGGTGIGAAIVQAFADAGAAVSMAGRRNAPLAELASRLPKAAAITADVTDAKSCAAMVERARAAHGPIDIVVANAGAADSMPVAQITPEHWQRMIGVNLTGAFNTVQAALADVKRAKGRVVFIASTAGLRGFPYVAAYCAAKHGVVGLARALGVELAASGVAVGAVCPGFTDTPLLAASIDLISKKTGKSAADARAALARENAGGRLITPQEVADKVLWLCTTDGANGRIVEVAA